MGQEHVQKSVLGRTDGMVQTPGLTEALQPSWEAPNEIKILLAPLPYEIEVNGKTKCAHIKSLKLYHVKSVRRVTTTLEDDKGDDVLEITNPSVTIDVGEVDETFLLV